MTTKGIKTGGVKAKYTTHKFVEAHKDEITADYNTLGPKSMLKKWGISNSGWHTIRKRWGLPLQSRAPVKKTPALNPPHPKKDSSLEELYQLRGYQQAVREILGISKA